MLEKLYWTTIRNNIKSMFNVKTIISILERNGGLSIEQIIDIFQIENQIIVFSNNRIELERMLKNNDVFELNSNNNKWHLKENKSIDIKEMILENGIEFERTVDVINHITGRGLRGYQSGHYNLNTEYMIWFPHFSIDGKPLRKGWINSISPDGNHIYEKNINFKFEKDKNDLPKNRIVFASNGNHGPYKFYGVFTRDSSKSNADQRIYKIVSKDFRYTIEK